MIEEITNAVIADNNHLKHCNDKHILNEISMRIKQLVVSKQLNNLIGVSLLEQINKRAKTIFVEEKIREIHKNRY